MNAVTHAPARAFDLGPLAQEAPPDVALRMAEQRELLRQAYARSIAMHDAGRYVDPEHLKAARVFVAAHRPLGRPLSDGDPRNIPCTICGSPDHTASSCPRDKERRRGAKEVQA